MSAFPSFIRAATTSDVPALHAVIERAYRGTQATRGWTHEAALIEGPRTTATALATIIADPSQRMLVAVEDEIVGCVQVTALGAGRAYIGQLAVDPHRQTHGVGRQMLAAAEAFALSAFAANQLEMTVVSVRSELIAYYQRRGWTLTDTMLPMPEGIGVISQPLHFVVMTRLLANTNPPLSS